VRICEDGDSIEMLQCGLLRSLKIYVDGLGVARLGEKNRKKEEEKEREQEEEI